MDIVEQLNGLAELKFQENVIKMHYHELRDSIMPPEVKQGLADIDAEESTAIEAVHNAINTMTEQVKADVITIGESVKGEYLHAVYSKPRVTWDTKGIEGYAVTHPEINTFRKVGAPSVSIKAV